VISSGPSVLQYIKKGPQGHHLTQWLRPTVPDVAGIEAVAAFGLDVDLEHLVEFIEQVYRTRAQVGLEGGEDVTSGTWSASALGAVDVEIELRAAGAETWWAAFAWSDRSSRPAQLRLSPAGDSARPRLPRSSTIIWEAARLPQSRIGGGDQHNGLCFLDLTRSRFRPL